MLYVLFGEMGVGKNYVGERLAEFLGCEFFDGDLLVPPAMIEKVSKFEGLTLEIIDDYVYNHLIPGIDARYDRQKPLVVAQALYLNKHRQAITDHFGPQTTKLVYLPMPSVVTHMKRLYSRKNGFRWMLYGLMNKPFFEQPTSHSLVILNKTNEELHPQFEGMRRRW